MAKIEKTSPHRGIDFDDFLKEQGVFEEVMSSPKVKKAIRDLEESIQAGQHEAFTAGRGIISLVVALLCGCAGYTVGPIQPTFVKGVRTVADPIFGNKTKPGDSASQIGTETAETGKTVAERRKLQVQVDTTARSDFVGPPVPTPTPSASPVLTPAQKNEPLTPQKDVAPTAPPEPNLPTQ
jgi:hypothetical protein